MGARWVGIRLFVNRMRYLFLVGVKLKQIEEKRNGARELEVSRRCRDEPSNEKRGGRTDHEFGSDLLVELLGSEEAERDGRLLEGRSLLVSLLGALGDVVITEMGVEDGGEHEGLVEEG
jgi:hypothetical protein